MDEQHTYKVVELNETDTYATKIAKGNITAEFTIHQLIAENDSIEKELKAKRGQVKLAQDMMANLEEHHPFVKDLDSKQLIAAHLYAENKGMLDKFLPFVEMLEKAQKEGQEELVTIAALTGLDILPKTKEEVVTEAVDKIVEDAKEGN